MKNTLKKIIPIFLIAVLFVSLFPITASASTYQSWVGYPASPIDLDLYPYQVITMVNSITRVYASNMPIGVIGGGYYFNAQKTSLYNGTSWGSSIGAGTIMLNTTNPKSSIIEANNDILDNSDNAIEGGYAGNVWFAKTTNSNGTAVLNIDDTGMPERTMDYYIVWDDETSGALYYQEFNGKPIVAIYDETNASSNIYDISWEGTGVSKKYSYNNVTMAWDLVTETLPSNVWEEPRSIKKIYGTNISLGVSGNIEDIGQMGNFGGGLDIEGFGIRFLLPRDGFTDNSFLFSYMVEYRIPWDDPTASPSDVKVNFDGDGKADTMKTDYNSYDIVNEVLIGTIKISVGQEYGQSIVRAFIGSQEAPLYQASVRTTRLEGFVDVNNDKLDDRTLREDANTEQPWDSSTYNPGGQPESSAYGDDLLGRVQYGFDTLFYWLTSPFRLVADGFDAIITTMEESFGWATDFSIMITGLFSFLPGPVVSLLGLAFVTIIVVAVIKVVRG